MKTISAESIHGGRQILAAYNEAVLLGDDSEARALVAAFGAIIERENGGSRIGTYTDEDAPGSQLVAALRAEDGQAPLWGQAGRFLVEVQGLAAVVTYRGLGCLSHHMGFEAVDILGPFISKTGYQSDFPQPVEGYTVKALAEHQLAAFIKDQGLVAVEASKHNTQSAAELSALPWVVDGFRADGSANRLPHEFQMSLL